MHQWRFVNKRISCKINKNNCKNTQKRGREHPQGMDLHFPQDDDYVPSPKIPKVVAVPKRPDNGLHSRRISNLDGGLVMQSGTTGDVDIKESSTETKQENVVFMDQHDAYDYDMLSIYDPTRYVQSTSDTSLDNFFRRPVKIHQMLWGIGTNDFFDIDPWTLFWENSRVSNRIANYNLLKCKMRVKVVINGNGFYFGRSMVAYQPYPNNDDLSEFDPVESANLVGMSQLPHIFINPTTSTGGEMTLPFFWHKESLNIVNGDWENLGALRLRTMIPLATASDITDPLTITVFAWAEDVELSVLTSTNPQGLTAQSGNAKSEVDQANSNGTISGPATAVSRWVAHLTNVPYIAPFAMATMIMSDATAALAKLFGYSRPAVTTNPEPYRPTACSSLAVTTTPDTALKLTVDDKQELTIDPRIAGISPVDTMNILEIAKRESYIGDFFWSTASTSEALLWNTRVDPIRWMQSGTPTAYHFPAVAMAALPFKFWSGKLRFRFQIVCSAFHKGRIKVIYDPNSISGTDYNTNYMKIVDIAEEQDFTIEVSNGQEWAILPHAVPGVDSPGMGNGLLSATDTGNGILGIYVMNKLTVPNAATPPLIYVNVFVSAGEDFQVYCPDDHFSKFDFFEPQSGFVPQSGLVPDAIGDNENDAPQQSNVITLGVPTTPHPDMNKVYMGETIASFRSMLKRYTNWRTDMHVGSSGLQQTMETLNAYPYLRGYQPFGIHSTVTSLPYTYCNNTLMSWVRNAHSGWRGSIRYKFLPSGDTYGGNAGYDLTVQRGSPNTLGYSGVARSIWPVGTTLTSSQLAQLGVSRTAANGVPAFGYPPSGINGMVYTATKVNPVLEVEIPFYAKRRFGAGKTGDYITTNPRGGTGYTVYSEFRSQNTNPFGYHQYVAAGEDFQVYFFSGLPRVWYAPDSPLPDT